MLYNEKDNAVKFVEIDKLGPGKELILGVVVTVGAGTQTGHLSCLRHSR